MVITKGVDSALCSSSRGFLSLQSNVSRNSSEMRDYLTDIWIITSLEPLLCVPVDIVPLGPDLVKVMAGTQWCTPSWPGIRDTGLQAQQGKVLQANLRCLF